MKTKELKVKDDDWIKEYRPIAEDGIAEGLDSGYDCGDGPCMWETYGNDIVEINRRLTDPVWEGRIWTVYDDWSISEGYHFVNRYGYICTEKPAKKGVHYYISDEEDNTH